MGHRLVELCVLLPYRRACLTVADVVASEFTLQEDSSRLLEPLIEIGDRWKELPHAPTRQRGLILIPGEALVLPPLALGPAHEIHATFMRGSDSLSKDGLTLDIVCVTESGDRLLAQLPISTDDPVPAVHSLVLSLECIAGEISRIEVRCGAGPEGDPDGDWLALIAVAVGRADRIPLLMAESQHEWRLANEIDRFSDSYRHEIYSSRDRPPDEESAGASRPVCEIETIGNPHVGHEQEDSANRRSEASKLLQSLPPIAGENAYSYAHRLLTAVLPPKPIDFSARLRQLASGGQVSFLSLCAGEAGIEAELLRQAKVPVNITLLDVNEKLLQRARHNMPQNANPRLIKADVRQLDAAIGLHDVVAFVSGLHHVVHLEEALHGIRQLLTENGEFWLIGEQVGRNGNRLWPAAYAYADALFRELPGRLRQNLTTGELDEGLPNPDFASSCFEGIRSQEIPEMVGRWFLPHITYERNCFLWRFVDGNYAGNYDLNRDDDTEYMQKIVVEEYLYWLEGGRSTELNGIYYPRERVAKS